MGKRKSARKPQKKLKQVLDKEFACLFCNHEKSVTTKIDTANKVGNLTCSMCGVSFQTPVTALSEPVDIYSDWIDACEKANEEAAALQAARFSSNGGRSGHDDDDEDLEDPRSAHIGTIDEDSGDEDLI